MKSSRTQKSFLLFGLFGAVFFAFVWISAKPTQAATGINKTINFQGRLLNSQGATVPDGSYNIEFKIYQDGDGQSVGDTTGSPSGTLKWTEDYLNNNSHGVTVINGYLSVSLGSVTPFGSNIDWNQDTLWLSMNIGGTGPACTPFSSCSPDGEMIPMQPMTAAPYALNAGELGGLDSSQFVQLAQGVQTDGGTGTNSIYINKTGTGNLLDLQSGGSDAFVLSNNGDVSFGANANHTISVATAGAGVAGKSLTISSGAAGSGGSTLAGGNLVLQGGAGGGTNGNGGNVSVDAGVKNGSGADGIINIGTTTASAVNISKTGVTTAVGGSLTVASTINTATISGGTLSGGAVSGGTLTGTAVNGLNVSSTAIAVSAAATGLTVDAGTSGT
ncbi:MAG TPA: hypothetical protein VLF39_03560, partial [Candidatus Saccharimonadales bacterium]|nr:hypothetical protein [Candidatus Saccharimonadales bacterium]